MLNVRYANLFRLSMVMVCFYTIFQRLYTKYNGENYVYLKKNINGSVCLILVLNIWVKVFRIIPEFRILRLTFHRKSASKC